MSADVLFECFTILTERNVVFGTTIRVFELPLSASVALQESASHLRLQLARGRCSLITVIPIAGGSSVFGVWLSVDLGDQNPPSSWWVICPNVAGLGHAGQS